MFKLAGYKKVTLPCEHLGYVCKTNTLCNEIRKSRFSENFLENFAFEN
jgi:hypothetical protein